MLHQGYDDSDSSRLAFAELATEFALIYMALHKEDAHIAFILVMESPSSTLNPFARTVVPILDDECYVETNYRRLLYISINIVIA